MVKFKNRFSKLTKIQKIEWLSNYVNDPNFVTLLKIYWNSDTDLQKLHDDFIENTLSNFYLPYAVAPNFLINGLLMTIPMSIEESSIVAAAANSAKYWGDRGGFLTNVISVTKVGQVHFKYKGKENSIVAFFSKNKQNLANKLSFVLKNMEKRGGGLKDIQLLNKTSEKTNYYQLFCTFETVDAMGANVINTCLEILAKEFKELLKNEHQLPKNEREVDILMGILSNYSPDCLVRASVSCPIDEVDKTDIKSGWRFAEKFVDAVDIAKVDIFRAVTHNKGIMNGVDAVAIATGNDFRAIEACIHAFASKTGRYKALTDATIENDTFSFFIEIPLSVGTVGGVTSIHPLAKLSLKILQNPTAKELMQIMAVAGLAQNFSALRSLVTTGIQKGHMKLHLQNILAQLNVNCEKKKQEIIKHFTSRVVSFSAVKERLDELKK